MIAFLADLFKLPADAVGPALVVLGAMLVIVLINRVFRYLERRSDNGLIAEHIKGSQSPQPAVIQAIRGTAIAGAATATGSEAEPVDVEADVDGVVRRVTGWMRDLKLPPGG